MSRKDFTTAPVHGREVKVDILKPRRNTHVPTLALETGRGIAKVSSRSLDYVYVNHAYAGSANSVAGSANNVNRIPEPPTSVYREQYWACSKWPFAQKVLALTVGVLLGAIIGLSIGYATGGVTPDDVIGGFFRANPEAATH